MNKALGYWFTPGSFAAGAGQTQTLLEKMRAIEDERATAKYLALQDSLHAHLKERLFQYKSKVESLEAELQTCPLQVHVLATWLGDALIREGFTSEMFPDFHDKEDLKETRAKFVSLIDRSKSLLDAKQTATAGKCFVLIQRRHALNEAIAMANAADDLAAIQPIWSAYEKMRIHNLKLAWVLIGVLGVFLLASLPYFSWADKQFFVVDQRGMYKLLGAMVLAGVVVALVVLYAILSDSKPKDYGSVRDEVQELRIAAMDVLPEKWAQVERMFGGRDRKHLRKIIEEDDAELETLMGDAAPALNEL